jgi:hypothetical protein
MEKQGSIPGTEEAQIDEIQQAAELYEEARDTRMEAGKAEVERRTALMQVMHKHDRTTYRGACGLTVEMVAGDEKVKVRRSETKGTQEL